MNAAEITILGFCRAIKQEEPNLCGHHMLVINVHSSSYRAIWLRIALLQLLVAKVPGIGVAFICMSMLTWVLSGVRRKINNLLTLSYVCLVLL